MPMEVDMLAHMKMTSVMVMEFIHMYQEISRVLSMIIPMIEASHEGTPGSGNTTNDMAKEN